MKFKIGDTVRVRDDLIQGNNYNGGCIFFAEMSKYKGTTAKITSSWLYDENARYTLDTSSFMYSDDMLEPARDKIIITLDGNTVSMKFCKNNKVVTFSDLDCFDDCGNLVVKLESCNETEKTFVPHLEDNIIGNKLGEIGKETKFVDVVGRKLCVGDVVELFDNNSESYGDRVVVEDNNTQFVMGISIACDCKTGHIGNDWKIIKKRSYKDVNNGETINGVKFITEVKPPKYYSGKLVCVESNYRHYWTVGKIYECVDGTLPTNLGSDRCLKKCRDLDDINVRNFARFIELKE